MDSFLLHKHIVSAISYKIISIRVALLAHNGKLFTHTFFTPSATIHAMKLLYVDLRQSISYFKVSPNAYTNLNVNASLAVRSIKKKNKLKIDSCET